VLLPGGAVAAPELKGDPDELARYLVDDKKTVTLYGFGEERIYANHAIVSLVVKTKESKLLQALEQNTAIRNHIRNKLLAKGITADNIQSSRYSSTPVYSSFKDKPTSYEISNEVKITIVKEEEMLAVADIVDNLEQVYFARTEAKDTLKRDSQDKALDKALKNVLAKKRLYEEALGVTLVALKVNDQGVAQDGVNVAGAGKFSAANDSVSSMTVTDSGKTSNAAGRFGEINYQSNIGVTYLIKPR
ncbi:MAG: SIMPL domain-containing protein, partial [Gammaproteobacteria bacterium]|nr:SIMPL domain-containing protein [Gammaproteobacteria bacterium]